MGWGGRGGWGGTSKKTESEWVSRRASERPDKQLFIKAAETRAPYPHPSSTHPHICSHFALFIHMPQRGVSSGRAFRKHMAPREMSHWAPLNICLGNVRYKQRLLAHRGHLQDVKEAKATLHQSSQLLGQSRHGRVQAARPCMKWGGQLGPQPQGRSVWAST